jgi:hypothetical protein
VFVEVALDVTTIVAVHNTPGVNPLIVILLSAVTTEMEFVNTVVLSKSLVTVTDTLTPADGNAEDTLTIIGCDVPTTANIDPEPGSTFTVNAIVASTTGVGVTGVGVGVSLPLLQEKKKKIIAIKTSFKVLIFLKFYHFKLIA